VPFSSPSGCGICFTEQRAITMRLVDGPSTCDGKQKLSGYVEWRLLELPALYLIVQLVKNAGVVAKDFDSGPLASLFGGLLRLYSASTRHSGNAAIPTA
jgi:hypothetical protein